MTKRTSGLYLANQIGKGLVGYKSSYRSQMGSSEASNLKALKGEKDPRREKRIKNLIYQSCQSSYRGK